MYVIHVYINTSAWRHRLHCDRFLRIIHENVFLFEDKIDTNVYWTNMEWSNQVREHLTTQNMPVPLRTDTVHSTGNTNCAKWECLTIPSDGAFPKEHSVFPTGYPQLCQMGMPYDPSWWPKQTYLIINDMLQMEHSFWDPKVFFHF